MEWIVVLLLAPLVAGLVRWLLSGPRRKLPPAAGEPTAAFRVEVGWRRHLLRLNPWVRGALALILLPCLLLVALAVPMILLIEAKGTRPPPWAMLVLLVLSVASSIGGILWAVRHARRAAPPAALLFADRLVIPMDSPWGFMVHVTLPLTEIRLLRWVPGRGLVIDLERETRLLPASLFAEKDDGPRLEGALLAAISRAPAGPRQLAEMESAQEATATMARRPERHTVTVLAILCFVFLLQWVLGALREPEALYRMGANAARAVARGEWFRLVTSNLMHGGLLHLLSNLAAIASFGAMLEKLLGGPRFLVLYLASGLTGALASAQVDTLAVGASTAAFGVMAGLAVVQHRLGSAIPRGFRIRRADWLTLGAVNAALPLFVPRISWAGHLGGALGGAILAAWMSGSSTALDREKPTPRGVRVVLALLLAIQAAGLAAALAYARGDGNFVREYRSTVCPGIPPGAPCRP